jgi:hypothetical protein
MVIQSVICLLLAKGLSQAEIHQEVAAVYRANAKTF